MRFGGIVGITLLLAAIILTTAEASGEGTKTFAGASLVLPAVLPIIGTIIPALIPGLAPPGAGSGGGVGPALPGVSVSHSTSIATSVHNRPIAISHSGSVSTHGNTDAGSAASAGSSQGIVSGQSSAGTSRKYASSNTPLLSKRWRKFFKTLG